MEPVDVAEFRISVLNAARISQFASRTSERLEEAGFNVVDIGNYEEGPIERTIITVPLREVGEVLANYFNNPKVVVDENLMDEEIQVIIAIGTNDDDR